MTSYSEAGVLSAKELAEYAARQQKNKNMPSNYRLDTWVNQQLELALITHSAAAVYWPNGQQGSVTALSTDDVTWLQTIMADKANNLILIPENSGNHWYLTCLHRTDDKTWESVKINTRADGTCGDSTVEEARKLMEKSNDIAQLSTEVESRKNQINNVGKAIPAPPTVVNGVKLDGVKVQKKILQPIADLLIKPAPIAAAESMHQHNESYIINCVFNESTRGISTIDYLLSKLADEEYKAKLEITPNKETKSKIDEYKAKIISEFAKLDDSNYNKALGRLQSLAGKPTIDKIISKVSTRGNYDHYSQSSADLKIDAPASKLAGVSDSKGLRP